MPESDYRKTDDELAQQIFDDLCRRLPSGVYLRVLDHLLTHETAMAYLGTPQELKHHDDVYETLRRRNKPLAVQGGDA